MAEIVANNIEGGIITDLYDALNGATISGVKFFDVVSIRASEESAAGTKLLSPRIAMVICNEITEAHASELKRAGQVSVTIFVAFRGDNEVDTTEGVTRLMAGARNAIEGSPPSDAEAVGIDDSEDGFHTPLEWGDMILNDDRVPWLIATIPLMVNFTTQSPTVH